MRQQRECVTDDDNDNHIIFSVCRQLKCNRIRIHKNLFLSYILNGIVWIMYYSLAALNVGVLDKNPVGDTAAPPDDNKIISCTLFWLHNSTVLVLLYVYFFNSLLIVLSFHILLLNYKIRCVAIIVYVFLR